jgi:hypothetical protein
MVSQRLENFANLFAGWGATPHATILGPETARAIGAIFRDLAGQSAAIEGAPISAAQRGDLPPEVARLDVARARRRSGLPLLGGGHAA